MWMRGVLAGVVVVVAVGTVSGCTTSSVGDRAGCVPRTDVSPRTAHPGDVVTLTTTDACDVPVPDDGWEVSAFAPVEGAQHTTVRSDEPLDGSWSASVTLPSDFPLGEATFGIENWDFSTCPDDASCAAPFGSFRVVAP